LDALQIGPARRQPVQRRSRLRRPSRSDARHL